MNHSYEHRKQKAIVRLVKDGKPLRENVSSAIFRAGGNGRYPELCRKIVRAIFTFNFMRIDLIQ